MPDTIQRERERQFARRQLDKLFAAPERAFAIHYALQQRLRRDQTDVTPPVAAVTVRNLGTGREHVFSIKAAAELAGIDLSVPLRPGQLLALEYSMLFSLNEFLSRHSDSMLIHWYMRDQRYGFTALEARYRKTLSDVLEGIHGTRSTAAAWPFGFDSSPSPYPVQVAEEQRVDLALVLEQLYDIEKVGLQQLAASNGLSHAKLIEGINEPVAFAEGDHARLAWSSAAKTRLIVEIAKLARRGTIKPPREQLSGPQSGGLHIFINYRREDTQMAANWLHAILTEEFGDENVFIDTDDIPAGHDFEGHLRSQIDRCDVFLAIIGKGWAGAVDARGSIRLSNERDFVRREIRAALARGIPVIPVLVEGTPMPGELQLPSDIEPLRRRQSVALRSHEFRQDVERLVVKIREAHRIGRRVDAPGLA